MMKRGLIGAVALLLVLGTWRANAASGPSATTAFAFSGTLAEPNGTYDFQFQAFDAPSGGTLLAGPVTVAGVRVTSTKYSTIIDFGSDPFTSGARFLQIGWGPAGSGAFTQLSKRVQLLAVPYALGLQLPVSETTSSAANGLVVSNTGSGAGVTGSAATNYGVTGYSSSGFAGIYGTSGLNGLFGDTSNVNGSGVYGHNSGAGAGVAGISDAGGYGVSGVGSSTSFAGVYGTSGRNGLYGQSTSSSDSGVYGHNAGTGYGVTGFSDGGIGGFFSGGGGSNPALKLQNGGIEVAGAGTDTATPVFTHVVSSSNTCGNGGDTFLDDPLINGNANAFVFAQPSQFGDKAALDVAYLFYQYQDCPIDHWLVFHQDGSKFLTGDTFAVLALTP